MHDSLKEVQTKNKPAKGSTVRDWNAEFYQQFSDGMLGLTSERVKMLSDLTNDFVACATDYAKVIVNELSVDVSQKQIKVCTLTCFLVASDIC